MYTVSVEDSFAAAHQLAHFHGKCERLHGHNYRVRVTARGRDLDDSGMIVDFGILKIALCKITAELDHTSLNDHPAFKDGSPTAERIARFVFDRLAKQVPAGAVSMVEVFETERTKAAYIPD